MIRFLKKKGYFRDGITDSVDEEDQIALGEGRVGPPGAAPGQNQ